MCYNLYMTKHSAKTIRLETLEELFEIIESKLIWKKVPKNRAQLLGTECATMLHGYKCVAINRSQYRVHRIMYQMYNKLDILDPKLLIDHIDGNTLNNAKDNLRLATHAQNAHNRKSNKNPHKCIFHSKIKSDGIVYEYWKVQIQGNIKFNVQRCFPYSEEGLKDAIAFRDRMLIEIHGEFANLG